jgi:hypothetical protein
LHNRRKYARTSLNSQFIHQKWGERETDVEWTKLHIQQSNVADKTAKEVLEQFSIAVREDGTGEGIEVYHLHIPLVGHAYYFNPPAAHTGKKILANHSDVSLVDLPTLAGLRRITF